MTVRVLLADDEQLVRAGFRLILESESDFEVVGEAGNGAEAVELTKKLDPDVVLMDVQMPEMNGLEATRRIAALGRKETSRVLVLTTFEVDEYVYEALRAGASGFLLKRTHAVDLVAGIRVVAGGDALLAPSVTRRLIDQFAHRPAAKQTDAKFGDHWWSGGLLPWRRRRRRDAERLVHRHRKRTSTSSGNSISAARTQAVIRLRHRVWIRAASCSSHAGC